MQKQREHNQSQSISSFPPGRNRPITGRSLANVERTEEKEVNKDEGEDNIKMKMIWEGQMQLNRVIRIEEKSCKEVVTIRYSRF